MYFNPTERSALYIDGVHLHSIGRAIGFEIDFKRLLAFFQSQCNLVRANYYTALPDTDDTITVKPLVDWLAYNGFNVVTKKVREYRDDEGRLRIKGRMDAEIIVDALEMASHVDHIILAVGDSNYRRPVEALQHKGVRVTVLSALMTDSPFVADDLRRQADQFVDVTSIMNQITRIEPRRNRGESPNPEPGVAV